LPFLSPLLPGLPDHLSFGLITCPHSLVSSLVKGQGLKAFKHLARHTCSHCSALLHPPSSVNKYLLRMRPAPSAPMGRKSFPPAFKIHFPSLSFFSLPPPVVGDYFYIHVSLTGDQSIVPRQEVFYGQCNAVLFSPSDGFRFSYFWFYYDSSLTSQVAKLSVILSLPQPTLSSRSFPFSFFLFVAPFLFPPLFVFCSNAPFLPVGATPPLAFSSSSLSPTGPLSHFPSRLCSRTFSSHPHFDVPI